MVTIEKTDVFKLKTKIFTSANHRVNWFFSSRGLFSFLYTLFGLALEFLLILLFFYTFFTFFFSQNFDIFVCPKGKNESSNFQTIFGIGIRVEAQIARPGQVTQYHRCYQFGHSCLKCNAEPRCARCIYKYATKDCLKPAGHKTKCLNCEGEHAANYRLCPKNPSASLIEAQVPPKPVNPTPKMNLKDTSTRSPRQTQIFTN